MSSTDDLPPPTTLSDFFKAVHDTPVTVRAVHVVGLKGTRRSLVEHAITNTLQSRTFGTLLEQSQRAGGLLTALEVAKAVHVKIDTAPQAQERKNPALAMLLGGLGGGGASAASKGSHREQKSPSSGPEEVDVILSCDSIGRIRLKTGTEVGQDEVGVNTVGTLVNMFGGGETLTGSVAYGTRTTSDYKLHYSMPIAYDPLRRFDCLLHHANTDHQLRSSYDELNRGILLKYQTYADGMLGGWLPRCWRDD
ncbi:hypothetical protein GQ42DRAFT_152788 [Ramicandelaber brevisporus]|nr:hypothetical protein GQ42DRAFT_152788 [Ramicandelaber brevisporus]